MIATVVAVIFLFELIFTMFGVKPTTGQYFKVYYDINFSSSNENSLKLEQMISAKGALSYDVLKTDYEVLSSEANYLDTRLSVYEGDVIITDCAKKDEEDVTQTARTELLIDTYSIYTIDGLIKDAKDYLNKFTTDGALDDEKIYEYFLARMKKDNRFRTQEEKEAGKLLEKQRIEKLYNDVAELEYFLANASEDCFYRYTKYTVRVNNTTGETKANYEKALQNEIDNGREDAIYGINLGALKEGEGETKASEYFKANGNDTAKDAVLLVFNFLSEQPDLQFEGISFIATVLRECSNII